MNKFKTLTDHVYDYITEKILIGEISPGEKINEHKICNELAVSRTPVREALIELSCDGVLENVPRRGFLVRNLTLKDFAELYSVIGILEGQAAKLACENLDEKDLEDMKFYLKSMYLAIEQGNYSMYHNQQDSFHQIFIEKCENGTLISTLNHLKIQLLKRDFDEVSQPDIKDILYDTNKEHEKIYELFLSKDGAAVSKYLSEVHWRQPQATWELL